VHKNADNKNKDKSHHTQRTIGNDSSNILIRTNEKGEMLIKTQIKITMLENEQDAVSSSHTGYFSQHYAET